MVFLTIAALAFLNSCETEQKSEVSVSDRKKAPVLFEDSITALVSDSGVLRYRLTTNQWFVYDKADTPYWSFPEGIRFERFDINYNIDAAIECNKATYFSEMEKWHLEGNIRAQNLSGERFYTEELYWDQRNEIVESDKSITIIQRDKKIVGKGFRANQTFTQYSILQPTGIFPLEEQEETESGSSENP
ncbi:MAG: LPS export ABC transporter periplasmic protein LptC [Paludibacteraceae bacterium]|nr:LPS export ABC transporter periplasmic protein LptC [Paludibacteraceae bacterium]